jgi:transposase-like protein
VRIWILLLVTARPASKLNLLCKLQAQGDVRMICANAGKAEPIRSLLANRLAFHISCPLNR